MKCLPSLSKYCQGHCLRIMLPSLPIIKFNNTNERLFVYLDARKTKLRDDLPAPWISVFMFESFEMNELNALPWIYWPLLLFVCYRERAAPDLTVSCLLKACVVRSSEFLAASKATTASACSYFFLDDSKPSNRCLFCLAFSISCSLRSMRRNPTK